MPCLLRTDTDANVATVLTNCPNSFNTYIFQEKCKQTTLGKPCNLRSNACGLRLSKYAQDNSTRLKQDGRDQNAAMWQKPHAVISENSTTGVAKPVPPIKPGVNPPSDIGPQYSNDDDFKRRARLHQSKYRAYVLRVGYQDYGNRLLDQDAMNWLNYYELLGVREEKIASFPTYSRNRDADMLRSEHMPFNFFAPMRRDKQIAKRVFSHWFPNIDNVESVEIEFAPRPRKKYLGDMTSFDAYILFQDKAQKKHGIGIEVKYTEDHYSLGETEGKQIADSESAYNKTTRNSELYIEGAMAQLSADACRQLWRNHILGKSMRNRGDIHAFTSILVYPSGNTHAIDSATRYKALLTKEKHDSFIGITMEDLIRAYIHDENTEVKKLGEYLQLRYIVCKDDKCLIVAGGH